MVCFCFLADIAECIVTDFAAGEIMYAYSGNVATGSRPSDPVIKVTVGTNTDVSPLYAISMNSASSESNREQECWVSYFRQLIHEEHANIPAVPLFPENRSCVSGYKLDALFGYVFHGMCTFVK